LGGGKGMKINNQEITKVKVKIIIQKILNSNPLGEWLGKEDTKTLHDLLTYHEEYEKKKGKGIKGFKIQINYYKQRGFYIYRIDGSSTDFSYLKCLQPPTLNSKIKAACRTAITEDILNFKEEAFKNSPTLICPLSKEILTFNSCHVDHFNPTFIDIFNEWITDKKISEQDINQTEDNSVRTYFINKDLEKGFRKFHNSKCNLRIISPTTHRNLRKKKDESISQIQED